MAGESPHFAILDEVERLLRLLDLEGLEGRVYRRLAFDQDWLATITLPAIALTGAGMEVSLGGTTGEHQMGLPVTIRLLFRHPISDPRLEAQLFRLRRKVRLAFQRKPLSVTAEGLIEVYRLEFTASPVVENLPAEYQLISSVLSFQAGLFEVIP